MDKDIQQFELDDSLEIRNTILRYMSFWPYLIVVILIFISVTFFYLRYTAFTYKTTSIIEILDESQNSEMALPTELTVFNRSMINLENEMNILKSFSLNSSAVKSLKANILYYTKTRFKDRQDDPNSWYDKYKLDFKIDTDLIEKKLKFIINSEDKNLEISMYDDEDNFVKSKKFKSLSTVNENHDFPFDLTIEAEADLSLDRQLVFIPVKDMVKNYRARIEMNILGTDSDQLSISMRHPNAIVSQQYLNELIRSFDQDGINDRKLEYSRTIEFVNIREKILREDLNLIELRKQNYKQLNNLSDISLDANNNIDLKSSYNSEIFQYESQKQITEYLIELIPNTEYSYLPLNIGLENFDLNNMINDYNNIVSNRNRYLNEGGSNNFLVKSLEPQLDDLSENISISLSNFLNSLDLKLKNLKLKETEFDNEYNRVPENEKILRSIERELSIKEALFLLLLQKREEASINLAVVKPTIKVIDYAITSEFSKQPNAKLVYLGSIVGSILLYFVVLYLWFIMDNKIHTKDQLTNLLNDNIPVIAEIPFIKNIESISNFAKSRSFVSESIRMLLSNLRFTTLDEDSNLKSQTILVTSSIKGEGKTLVSTNTAIALANDLKKDKKVILIGSDLRNPQIHKTFGVKRDQKGISEIVYKGSEKNYRDYVSKFGNLDVIFSGAIPPNPTAILSSDTFKNLIAILKNDYDYIIIDSAPCLIVSDTFQFIDIADSVIYIFRSNFTDSKIVDFINETHKVKKNKNFNLVFNAVGNSASYGYKYGYQYGYKYAYNYGYGYGYAADE